MIFRDFFLFNDISPYVSESQRGSPTTLSMRSNSYTFYCTVFLFLSFSVSQPGRLKKVQGLGWYLQEANIAQISLNLLDFEETAIHTAFEEAKKDLEVKTSLLLMYCFLKFIYSNIFHSF